MRGPLARIGQYAQDLLDDHRLGYRRYLVPGERRVFAVRRHWAILVRPLALLGAGVLAAGSALWFLPPTLGLIKEATIWGCFALVGHLLWQLVQWRTERFVATDQRVLLTQGLLYRRVGTLPLAKVTDLSYERSVPGRIVGYGTFVFESAGQDQAMRQVHWVPYPDVTYRLLVADMFATLPDPQDVAYLAARMADYDDLDLPSLGHPGEPGPDDHAPAPAVHGTDRIDEDAAIDDRHSRAIPVATPTRAETLFRSADLQAGHASTQTGPIRYYEDDVRYDDGTQDPPAR